MSLSGIICATVQIKTQEERRAQAALRVQESYDKGAPKLSDNEYHELLSSFVNNYFYTPDSWTLWIQEQFWKSKEQGTL